MIRQRNTKSALTHPDKAVGADTYLNGPTTKPHCSRSCSYRVRDMDVHFVSLLGMATAAATATNTSTEETMKGNSGRGGDMCFP